MEKKPDKRLSATTLQLFEEIFEPLVCLSREITIKYNAFNEKCEHNEAWRIVISSVCDCKLPEDFRLILVDMIQHSLKILHISLEEVNHVYWLPHIEYIKDKLHKLTLIVGDEHFVFTNDDSGLTRQHHFKSFTNSKLIGPKEGDIHLFNQCIRLKVVRFAEIWLTVILDSIDDVDLIYKLLIQSLEAKSEARLEPLNSVKKSDYFVQTDLSVSEIGYLFHLLVKTGVIHVPSYKNMDLIRWVTENFQSKTRTVIQPTSLRNKYFSPDLAALDKWEAILDQWIRLIRDERDFLSE
ncbi:MAG: hypothetical protein H8D88_01030 [Bacteroidetes bacterium]|nr:hypothetical protein [Bacteroidota bacterium]